MQEFEQVFNKKNTPRVLKNTHGVLRKSHGVFSENRGAKNNIVTLLSCYL